MFVERNTLRSDFQRSPTCKIVEPIFAKQKFSNSRNSREVFFFFLKKSKLSRLILVSCFVADLFFFPPEWLLETSVLKMFCNNVNYNHFIGHCGVFCGLQLEISGLKYILARSVHQSEARKFSYQRIRKLETIQMFALFSL